MFQTLKHLLTRAITWNKLERVGLVAPPSTTGIPVTVETALTSSPVFGAVRIISTAVATLPLCVFRRMPDDSRERAAEHTAYTLLHDEPNPESDPCVWWSAFVAQMLLHGRGAAEIERDGAGRPLALWLLAGDQVHAERTAAGQLYYRVGAEDVLLPDEIFYVPYFSVDGVSGRGVIEYARNAIGLNLAMESGAGAQFKNMVRPSGAIEAPPGLSDVARENIRKSIERANAGHQKTGRLIFLEDGVKFNPFAISNQDAQWIEGRAFGIQETARFFNISPTKLADLGRATWSNIGSENLSFIENTLRPILVPIEQQARRKLLTVDERKELYVEAVLEARLRGLTADRYAAYRVGLGNRPFLLPSEVRRWENLKAAPELDAAPPGPEPTPEPAADPPPPQDDDNGNPKSGDAADQ